MPIGYLTVCARTAEGAFPLQGVQVRLSDDRGLSLQEMVTDENGATAPVSLPTLQKILSQNPYIGGKPYTCYRIQARAEGFYPLYITGVPILEGETTILPLAFSLLLSAQPNPAPTHFDLTLPAVTQRVDCSQEGPLVDPCLLRQVAIPNPVTVHLGRPEAAVSNVRISFPDYIKNVVSNEIYPTWPATSLTANIYATISFALNRIFTEWYRGRGYNFDITCDPEYDLSFVYGSPTYAGISRAVDGIFNEYVHRPGLLVPYFTPFCNGISSTCPGLSQWGSVKLAGQGMDCLEILRTYYPGKVEISGTDLIADADTPYPGAPLQTGCSGTDVEYLQDCLTTIRTYYPSIPALSDLPGTFGATTRDAVGCFQRIFWLRITGIVEKADWYKICALSCAARHLTETTEEGIRLHIGSTPPSCRLCPGDSGENVALLQYLLRILSLLEPNLPCPGDNDAFDSRTLQAVSCYQQNVGLVPNGIVNATTWEALYNSYRIAQKILGLPH